MPIMDIRVKTIKSIFMTDLCSVRVSERDKKNFRDPVGPRKKCM